MRFLIDAQLPPALVRWLQERGHEAAHVQELLGATALDGAIAVYAAEGGFILLSKDADFVTERAAELRFVWLRCGNLTNRRLLAWLEPRWVGIERRLNVGDMLVEVRN